MVSRQVIDITLPLSKHTLVYPGDSPPCVQRVSDLHEGDSLTASVFTLGCHVGTHVDAPAHFWKQGKMLDQLPLESFYGPAMVFKLEGKHIVTPDDLIGLSIPSQYHIFFKTDNKDLLKTNTFSQRYCTLSKEAAEYLCQFAPRSVGWDYYSLDNSGNSEAFPAHMVFALSNIPVFVCLNLGEVTEGVFEFWGFPLRLEGVEGGPVRAVLIPTQKE